MKNIFRILSVMLVSAIIATGVLSVSALSGSGLPTDSYTYWEDIGAERKPAYNRPMYSVKSVLGADEIGVDDFKSVKDVTTDSKGNIYILDSDSRIVILNSSYKLIGEIGEVTRGNEKLSYSDARSIYVHTDGSIYICDTENARVIRITKDGIVTDLFLLPDSPLISDDFEYRPIRAAVDSHGYTYILSEGSYYGALLYDTEKSFVGFFGANKVVSGITGAVKNLMSRIFPNNAKKSASVRTLPFCFVDLVISEDDFLYTATGKTTTFERTGQIKKLSPGSGNNILESEGVIFTDDKFNTTFNNGQNLEQNISGLAVDGDGFIYCIDSSFGKVYLYDSKCRMLTSFGGGLGEGTQDGSFVSASAITLNGTDIIVSDAMRNNITVFEINSYGKLVKETILLTELGEYEAAEKGWNEVISLDRSFQPAYSGLARAELNHENYEKAMAYAKEGYDRETYALAFELYRQQLLSDNFSLIFYAVVILAMAAVAFLIAKKKKGFKILKSEELRLALSLNAHPSNTFDEIKEKGRGSIAICIVLTILFYITAVMQVLCGGFLFTQYDVTEFNSIFVLVRSAGLVVLWVISNWMVCTLMGGKGKLREIIVVTCYSLTPIIAARLLHIVLSNVLLPTESVFLSGLMVVAIGYALVLIVMGLIKIHDFSLSRLIGTSVLSILCMAALILLAVLVGMLLQQLGGFIATVFVEIIS